MNQEEVEHLSKLIESHIRRLRALEQQAAKYGKDCPPHILTEIEDIQEAIENVRRQLEHGTLPSFPQSNNLLKQIRRDIDATQEGLQQVIIEKRKEYRLFGIIPILLVSETVSQSFRLLVLMVAIGSVILLIGNAVVTVFKPQRVPTTLPTVPSTIATPIDLKAFPSAVSIQPTIIPPSPTPDALQVTTLVGHTEAINSAVYSPDGQYIVTASNDRTARIWNTKGQIQAILQGHEDAVYGVAWSPDGTTIATASADNTVRLWNNLGEVISILQGHEAAVLTLAFSPDGTRLASASADGLIILWDTATGLEIQQLVMSSLPVQTLAFSTDGKLLADGRQDGKISMWDTASGTLLKTLEQVDYGSVRAITFNPNNTIVAAGYSNGTVAFWDQVTDNVTSNTTGNSTPTAIESSNYVAVTAHKAPVWSVYFGPNGVQLTSASQDGTVFLWDVKAQKPLLPIFTSANGNGLSVAFTSPNTILYASSVDNTVLLWRNS